MRTFIRSQGLARTFLQAGALALTAGLTLLPDQIAAQTAPVDRREQGTLVMEDIPAIPDAVTASWRNYDRSRPALFLDWLGDGSMLYATFTARSPQLFVMTAPQGKGVQLTDYPEAVFNAVARPHSNDFVFFKDVDGNERTQGYFHGQDGQNTPFTEAGTRNESLIFSPDGQTMFWTRVTPGNGNWDIMAMQVGNAASRRVVLKGTGAVSPLDATADGRVLIHRDISSTSSELSILDAKSGVVRKLAPTGKSEVLYTGGKFVRGGHGILTLSTFNAAFQQLIEIDAVTAKTRTLTGAVKWDVEDFTLSPDEKTIAYSVNREGFSNLSIQDLATGRMLPGPTLPKGVLRGLKFSPDGEHIAIALNRSNNPVATSVWNMASRTLDLWIEGNIGGLTSADLVEPDLVKYRSFDGLSVPALVYRPKVPRGKTPVIIVVHGGPEEQARPDYNPNYQYWVREFGATVITPNIRGSSGYGKAYLDLDNGVLRGNAVKDIGALLKWIAAQPGMDSSRVAITGQSYGGFMSLSAQTTYSDELAGGISIAGTSNPVTFLENTEGYRRDLRRVEYGDERDPKVRAYLAGIAPANNAAKIRKPLLVVHGANDPRVPQSEADQIVKNVRAAGGTAWYLLAKDEGHGFSKRKNRGVERDVETMFLRKVLRLPD
jgi:dipeptidyl aminopeptidase/acylaminoacyl peptidase